MKKICALVLCALMLLCLASCKKTQAGHDQVLTDAVSAVKDYWQAMYDESTAETDGYFEIKNTRLITIGENELREFENVAYLVEFVLYTDYFGTAPYHDNACAYDTVIVYKDGTMEVTSNRIWHYRTTTYETDYSAFIAAIDDYHDTYNCIETLK